MIQILAASTSARVIAVIGERLSERVGLISSSVYIVVQDGCGSYAHEYGSDRQYGAPAQANAIDASNFISPRRLIYIGDAQ